MDIFNNVSEINLADSYSISSNIFDTYISRVQYTQELQLDSYSTYIFLFFCKIDLYQQNNNYFINHKKLYYFFTCCFTLIRDIIEKIRKITLFVKKRIPSSLVESTQDLIELNLSQNIQILKDLRFSAKRFFNLVNEKIS